MDSNEIFKIAPSSCSYIDEDFYKNNFGEDIKNPDYLTYAANIQIIRVDWILNKPEGLSFLHEILK